MKRNSFSLHAGFGSLAVLVVLLLVASSATAQIELSVQLGFEGRLTPEFYAPIRIKVQGYRGTAASRLRILQPVGNEWRGNATIRQELGYAIQSDGLYESVIPVYDPVNPVTIELVTGADTILASATIDPRGSMRPVPYPVLDGKIPRFDDRAAVTDVSVLPGQWWAFDSAESLWVASPLSGKAWEAVSQWVLAGGSLVVLTGTDFYRMDSPALRRLVPLIDPILAVSELGTSYLTSFRVEETNALLSNEALPLPVQGSEATIGMLSDEGFPLLIQGSYGAGHVALVTTQALSLTVETLANIAGMIVPSRLISLQESTEYLLGEQKVATLSALFVLGLLVSLGLVVCACAVIGRRSPRLGWAVVLVFVVTISVWAGFISNPATHVVDIYTTTTHVYVEAEVSFYMGYSSLYAQAGVPFSQAHKQDVIPVQYLPRTLKGADSYDLSTYPSYTRMSVSPGATRHWHTYGTSSSMFDVKLISDSTVRISNYCPWDFDEGWLVIDGLVHPLADISRGVREYSFTPGDSLRLAALVGSLNSDEIPMAAWKLIRELRQTLPLEKGVWLIAFADEEWLTSEEVTQKVRELTLVAAQSREVAREI